MISSSDTRWRAKRGFVVRMYYRPPTKVELPQDIQIVSRLEQDEDLTKGLSISYLVISIVYNLPFHTQLLQMLFDTEFGLGVTAWQDFDMEVSAKVLSSALISDLELQTNEKISETKLEHPVVNN